MAGPKNLASSEGRDVTNRIRFPVIFGCTPKSMITRVKVVQMTARGHDRISNVIVTVMGSDQFRSGIT